MMKLMIDMPIWKRPRVTDLVLDHYRRMRRRLAKEIKIDIAVVGSEGEASRSLAKQHGFSYVECQNDPLTGKWQAGLNLCRERDADLVMIAGSDDIIGDESLMRMIDIAVKHGPTGMVDYNFIDMLTGQMVYWPGYDEVRFGQTIGAFRLMRRNDVAAAGWSLWNETAHRATDAVMDRSLSCTWASCSRLDAVSTKTPDVINGFGAFVAPQHIYSDEARDEFLKKFTKETHQRILKEIEWYRSQPN